VGANLVRSAKASLLNSLPHPGQSSQSAQRSSKAARSAASPKTNSRSRAAKGQSIQQPVLAAAATPGASGGSDASFEEF